MSPLDGGRPTMKTSAQSPKKFLSAGLQMTRASQDEPRDEYSLKSDDPSHQDSELYQNKLNHKISIPILNNALKSPNMNLLGANRDIRSPIIPHTGYPNITSYFDNDIFASSANHMTSSAHITPTPTTRPDYFRSKSTSHNVTIVSPQSHHDTTPHPESLQDGSDSEYDSFILDDNSIITNKTNHAFMPKQEPTLASTRNYYNDFTTIDWAKSFIEKRRLDFELNQLHGFRGELTKWLKKLESWFLIVIISLVFALIAYFIGKVENFLVDFKQGYCITNWLASQIVCCNEHNSKKPKRKSLHPRSNETTSFFEDLIDYSDIFISENSETQCPNWNPWSTIFKSRGSQFSLDFGIYFILTILLALGAVLITMTTKTTTPLAANNNSTKGTSIIDQINKPRVIYTAYGSGVPEVKTILSGFIIRKFLGTYTLFAKTIALIFAIASGMSLGKEGPYVHLATCVGNIFCRFFPSINNNELSKKQILTASASAGVSLAFGSPLGGVLFTLEEVNHYLPSNQLFKIFFCSMCSSLFLKFMNPYGTGKTVLFEVTYKSDWKSTELIFFVIIGIVGGIFGSVFIKFSKWWPKTFRELSVIKGHPVVEVMIVATLTALVTFGNPYTKQAIPELLFDLSSPCEKENDSKLCPNSIGEMVTELNLLISAFFVKLVLTFITFGLKIPAGIYVPSMVIGALFGRIFAMSLQLLNVKYGLSFFCDGGNDTCIDFGIYSMISAGAFMAGVTRMNITLVTIIFELTSSYTYVLPISIAIAVSNWIASLIEENSLYESLLIKNDFPFLGTEIRPLDPKILAYEIIDDDEKIMTFIPNQLDNFDNNKETTGLLTAIDNQHQNSQFLNDSKQHNLTQSLYQSFNSLPNHGSDIVIDLTDKPFVSTTVLQLKLINLQKKGLIDGCIALTKNDSCVGIISLPELEFCLDKLREFCLEYSITDELYCKMTGLPGDTVIELNQFVKQKYTGNNHYSLDQEAGLDFDMVNSNINTSYEYDGNSILSSESRNFTAERVIQRNLHNKSDMILELLNSLTDLTSIVELSPIFINYNSELSLVQLIFEKIGNRVLVLLKEGKFYGVLHKKAFVDYCRKTKRG